MIKLEHYSSLVVNLKPEDFFHLYLKNYLSYCSYCFLLLRFSLKDGTVELRVINRQFRVWCLDCPERDLEFGITRGFRQVL